MGAAVTPGVILFHGFPGVQQNEDMAAELCRRGLTVFCLISGALGIRGRWEIGGLLTDARAAVKLCRNTTEWTRGGIGLLGYSLGGGSPCAWRRRCGSPRPRCWRRPFPGPTRRATGPIFEKRPGGRHGPLAQVWSDYLRAAQEDHPGEYLRKISPTPLLFVQGMKDRLVPPASTAALFALARLPKELLELKSEDHEFQADRAGVVAAVCGWLVPG